MNMEGTEVNMDQVVWFKVWDLTHGGAKRVPYVRVLRCFKEDQRQDVEAKLEKWLDLGFFQQTYFIDRKQDVSIKMIALTQDGVENIRAAYKYRFPEKFPDPLFLFPYNGYSKKFYDQYIIDMIMYLKNCKRKDCVFYDKEKGCCERSWVGIDYSMPMEDLVDEDGNWKKNVDFQKAGDVWCMDFMGTSRRVRYAPERTRVRKNKNS